MYLLTGISEVKIQIGLGNSLNTLKPRGQPKRMRKLSKTVIPNSMWTAGCCVRGTRVLGSFAVIGNNVPNKEKIEMSQVTVNQLESINRRESHKVRSRLSKSPLTIFFPGLVRISKGRLVASLGQVTSKKN